MATTQEVERVRPDTALVNHSPWVTAIASVSGFVNNDAGGTETRATDEGFGDDRIAGQTVREDIQEPHGPVVSGNRTGSPWFI